MAVVQLLAVNFALLMALIVALWAVNLKTRDPSFIDSWWPMGMVVAAWASLLQVGWNAHGLLIAGLCTAWGLRLGGYLFWRWRKHGPDRRYVSMMAKAKRDRGWDYPLASLLLVFILQGPLQWLVCLPVQLGHGPDPLGPLAFAGAVLAVVGIAFETIGDAQLAAFKADPANEGKVMDKGLWRYTRHPNYFGDACLWWGLWLIAAETGWLGVASIVGPLLITFLLTKWSGVPTTEGRMRKQRPDYEAYVQRTSAFIPMPPRKAPQSA